MATNKDILKKLDCVETKLMNGELEEIHQTVKEIKEVLLDPEDGIIVRVNKNTYCIGKLIRLKPGLKLFNRLLNLILNLQKITLNLFQI